MDLVWRVVLDFLLQGRSKKLRCAIDAETSCVVFQDSALPLEKRKFRTWARLLGFPVVKEQLESVDKAIVSRDVTSIRRLFRAAFHRCCTHVRIITQEADAAQSTHISWFAGTVHDNAVSRSCISAGPHANYAVGMTMVVCVQPTVKQWLNHTLLFHSSLEDDPELWKEQGRALQSAVHGAETPMRESDQSSNSSNHSGAVDGFATPTFSGMSGSKFRDYLASVSAAGEEQRCCACEKTYPPSLMFFVEDCMHSTCLRCITACGKRHVEAPGATPVNMPCPAFECERCLHPREVKSLVSTTDFAVLEFNEVRVALSDPVVCPSCTAMFDREFNDMPANDPLREKFVCGACGVDFCAECNEAPFHHGRPCRVQYGAAPTCRFCGNQATSSSTTTAAPSASMDLYPFVTTKWHICDAETCVERAKRCCNVAKSCGHLCRGTVGERQCVRCLESDCTMKHALHEGDDLCAICYVETLQEAPCLEISCGHVFHAHCLEEKLAKRWPTARITFNFLDCPLCSQEIQHPLLSAKIHAAYKYREVLESRFLERMKLEGLDEHEALITESSKYYKKPLEWCRENLTYYECFKCRKPYFGGLKECAGADREEPNREELVCGGCSAGSASCPKHGAQFLEFKCKYCCNLAVWFCWGTTHFCDLCHSPPRKTVRLECPGEELCPLKAKHLPNGTECAIGCAVCRSAHELNVKKVGAAPA
jgi:hypothetical protein